MRGREDVRDVTGFREWFSPRGWYAAVVAVVVGGMPLVTAAHAPAAVRYQVTHTIPVGNGPHAVAVDPDTRTVYVTNYLANTVSVIDEATMTVTRTIPVGFNPDGVAVDPAARTVYVANFLGNSVSVIDEVTSTVTATIPVGSNPDGVAVDPAAHTAYVPNFFGNSVSVISRCD